MNNTIDRYNAYNAIENLMKQENDYFERYMELNPSDGIRKRQHETMIGAYITVLHALKEVK